MEETIEWLNDSAVRLAADGLHEEAIASLQKGLLSDQHNHILWFNLALSYRALGRMQEARDSLVHAAEASPLDVDILDTLGVVLHETGDDRIAEECYKNALTLLPSNGRVWNNYGVLQFTQERYSEAVQSFEKAIALIPDFDDALYNLKDTYGELGRTEEMEKCEKILEQRGFNPD